VVEVLVGLSRVVHSRMVVVVVVDGEFDGHDLPLSLVVPWSPRAPLFAPEATNHRGSVYLRLCQPDARWRALLFLQKSRMATSVDARNH
jgi:hypothetical protein